MISWPFQEMRAITNLPFLNWSCNTANIVATQIERAWDRDFASRAHFDLEEVDSIAEDDDEVTVKLKSGRKPLTAHRVVVAAGYLNERTLGAFKSPSYWTPHTIEGPAEVVVSGTGDGGLIDAAFQLYSIQAVAAARALAHALKGKPIEDDVRVTEEEAATKADAGDEAGAFEDLERFYRSLPLEPEETDLLKTYLRSNGLTAKLFHVEPSCYSPYTSPINKVLVSACVDEATPRVIIARGKLVEKVPGDIVVETDGLEVPIDSSKLLVRHGAEPAVYSILDPTQRAALDAKTQPVLTAVTLDEYDEETFLKEPVRKVAPSPTYNTTRFHDELNALLTSLMTYALYGNPTDFKVERNKHASWQVRLSGEMPRTLAAMFPFSVNGISVSLTEADDSLFPAL